MAAGTPSYWALELECEILMFMWSFGPLNVIVICGGFYIMGVIIVDVLLTKCPVFWVHIRAPDCHGIIYLKYTSK